MKKHITKNEELRLTAFVTRGWGGNDSTLESFGYKINDGDYVTGPSFTSFIGESDPVKDPNNGGPYAERINNIPIPLAGLGTGLHKIAVWTKLVNGKELENFNFSFVLLDDEVFPDHKGNQIRKNTLVARKVGETYEEDKLRQGLRFVFDMPDFDTYTSSNGTVEIVATGALVSLTNSGLDFADKGENVLVQEELFPWQVGDNTYLSAYVYNIPEGAIETTIYARPYVQLSINGETAYVYGETKEDSLKDVYTRASAAGETFSEQVSDWFN